MGADAFVDPENNVYSRTPQLGKHLHENMIFLNFLMLVKVSAHMLDYVNFSSYVILSDLDIIFL